MLIIRVKNKEWYKKELEEKKWGKDKTINSNA